MRLQDRSRRQVPGFALAAAEAAAAICVTLALVVPSDAQFWGGGGGWGGWDRRPPRAIPQQQQPQQQQQQQQFSPFGGWWGTNPQVETKPQPPADFSRAPAPQRKAADAATATTPVLVLGDGMADWLASGLEDAFAENPDISIVRKNRAASGLIRYDTRRETEWAQVAREAIVAEKPKFIVMMIGVNDRQSIRERGPAGAAPVVRRPGSPRIAPTTPAAPAPAVAPDPELQAQQSADKQNAEMQTAPEQPVAAPEQERAANAGTAGNFEFHSEKWEAAYTKRIDATVVALKSAGVPVFWVGLPAQRGNRATSDSAYLNELYRGRAEKAGLSYVDVWDGFVDDQGRFTVQGPDFEGQTRRLRAGDGVYFTKAGARKLAHYVEREIQRSMATRAIPVALPAPEPAPAAPSARLPGGATTTRPLAGPVVPLTVSTGGGDELLGGGAGRGAPTRPVAVDPVATRVLTKGEPIAAPSGRADDFGWPRGSAVSAEPASAQPAAAVVSAPVAPPRVTPPRVAPSSVTAGQRANTEAPAEETKPPVRRRPPPVRTENNPPRPDGNPRPPQSISPSASGPSGWWR